MSDNNIEKKNSRKFGKLVESIGKATNRYRRTKKDMEEKVMEALDESN